MLGLIRRYGMYLNIKKAKLHQLLLSMTVMMERKVVLISSFPFIFKYSNYVALTLHIEGMSECSTPTRHLWSHTIISILSNYYQRLRVVSVSLSLLAVTILFHSLDLIFVFYRTRLSWRHHCHCNLYSHLKHDHEARHGRSGKEQANHH
jgi:hypothetical protein